MTTLAFDRSTVRTVDADGRLHVAVSNISKASVDPYYGHEIPGAERLGLQPDRVYYLLRHPDELAKGAASFNNLPILSEHVPVSADAHMPEIVIGSTGTDAVFTDPYLRNSTVIWARDAIEDIQSETKREWSCAYRYTADMTPGTFRGLRFDGIMRNIIGNHLALVEKGRAGEDVIVGDSQPKGLQMRKSRHALMLHGALVGLITPKLAQDAKLDLAPALKARGATAIANAVMGAVDGKLAMDGDIDVADVVQVIEAVQGVASAPDEGAPPVEDNDLNDADNSDDDEDFPPAVDADGDVLAKVMAFLEGKLSDEDMAALGSIAGGAAPAADEDETEDEPEGKPAMDADTITRRVMRNAAAIREAERAVAPHIGEVVAMDSAAAIYKLALDHAKVDTKGVHPSAYKAMVAMLPGKASAPIAMDRVGPSADFAKRFPGAAPLIIS